jgi:hypothetical protein
MLRRNERDMLKKVYIGKVPFIVVQF